MRQPLAPFESQLIDELGEFQAQKQLIEHRLVDRPAQRLLRGEAHRGVAPDRGQLVGHPGLLPAFAQLFEDGGLGLHRFQIGVNGLHALVSLDEVHGGLFPDALHAGYIVGGIPHEGLEIDDVDGVKAVLRPKGLGRHIPGGGLPHAGGHQLDPGRLGDQLERVLVPGDDHGLPAGGGIQL